MSLAAIADRTIIGISFRKRNYLRSSTANAAFGFVWLVAPIREA